MKLGVDRPEIARVYEAVEVFVDRCLRQRRSLALADDHADVDRVWGTAVTQELIAKFVDQPDVTERSYIEKLRDQLADASPQAAQLLTELTWFHVVISSFYKPDTKRRIINEVAEIRGAAVPGGVADEALECGLTATGMAFSARRPNQLWLLIRFAQGWLKASRDKNELLLADPWAFREFVFGIDGLADQTQRNALLHLIHPDTFEACVSQYHKADMVKALATDHEVDENVDRILATVRARLSAEFGEGFSFYGPEVRPLWDPESADPPTDDEDEVGEGIDGDRAAWLIRGSGGERVPEWLERGVCAVYFEDSFPFPVERGLNRDDLRAQAERAGVDIAAGGFNNDLGQIWRFVNAVSIGDYVVTVNGQDIYLGVVESEAKTTGGRGRRETYRSIDWLNADQPIRRAKVSPAVYSKLRTLLTLSNITSVLGRLEQWAAGNFPSDETTPAETRLSLRPPDPALREKLLFPSDWLQGVIDLLAEKRQIVLYGPPGTGKTYLAQHLANHLTDEAGTTELVQFHPSYTYEDFFEGYRPVPAAGGNIAFEIKPGPLRRLAEIARSEPGRPHLLIIDEINRANLAKVFGELYFLLEYRNRTISLQYSDEEFTLPENLYVIGTMNTADRSIALVDAAMRRRFYFVEMAPSTTPVDGLLAEWLRSKEIGDRPARLLEKLNSRLGDPDAAIGPSFLMHPQIDDDAVLERIWKHAIMPVLEERFYGTNQSLDRFTLSAIAAAVDQT